MKCVTGSTACNRVFIFNDCLKYDIWMHPSPELISFAPDYTAKDCLPSLGNLCTVDGFLIAFPALSDLGTIDSILTALEDFAADGSDIGCS